MPLHQGLGAHGLMGRHVVLDDGPEHSEAAILEHGHLLGRGRTSTPDL